MKQKQLSVECRSIVSSCVFRTRKSRPLDGVGSPDKKGWSTNPLLIHTLEVTPFTLIKREKFAVKKKQKNTPNWTELHRLHRRSWQPTYKTKIEKGDGLNCLWKTLQTFAPMMLQQVLHHAIQSNSECSIWKSLVSSFGTKKSNNPFS